jgi:feruloyl-CoA synthase
MTTPGPVRRRAVRIAPIDVVVRHGPDGIVYLHSPLSLGAYPVRLTDCLEHWAARAPARTFLAARGEDGAWRHVTYADALTRVRRIAQALLDRRLSRERPIAILSGNGIEHGLLALAAMLVGVPYVPVAPAYSLQTRDFVALRRIFALVGPALVFAADGAAFEPAIAQVLPKDAELVTCTPPPGRASTPFAELGRVAPTAAVDEARDRVSGATIAKVLFTSGSTGRPKGVVNTQQMLCCNQEMLRTVLQFLGDEPPVLCDWSPWNHTAGGNHNFGLVLYNGGTLYIDGGRPVPGLFETTIRNLREVPCTAHFAVPRLYEMLMPHLQRDAALREVFFRRLRLLFYAAAGLGQRFWDQLRDVALEACGEEILIMSGFGATETAPFAMSTGTSGAFAGLVGLPAPGLSMKLAPVGDKLEARVKGPSITPGYWRDDAQTSAAFDEEGYYRLGDAMHFADPRDPARGLVFDGRLAENFKLSTGTWVSVGPLRARFLAAAHGCAQDVVIAGPDRPFPVALVIPNLAACRAMAGLDAGALPGEVLGHSRVLDAFVRALDELASDSTGSSTFLVRALLIEEPPSLDAHEITVKGSLNQKVVLARRASLVDELYAEPPSPRVLACTVAGRA